MPTTQAGRIVYDRKLHKMTTRDALRIVQKLGPVEDWLEFADTVRMNHIMVQRMIKWWFSWWTDPEKEVPEGSLTGIIDIFKAIGSLLLEVMGIKALVRLIRRLGG